MKENGNNKTGGNNTLGNKVSGTTNTGTRHEIVPVKREDQPDPVYTWEELDNEQNANIESLNGLVEQTSSSRDLYEDTVSDISTNILNALDPYIEESPLASKIYDKLIELLNSDYQARVDEYDSAITDCSNTLNLIDC